MNECFECGKDITNRDYTAKLSVIDKVNRKLFIVPGFEFPVCKSDYSSLGPFMHDHLSVEKTGLYLAFIVALNDNVDYGNVMGGRIYEYIQIEDAKRNMPQTFKRLNLIFDNFDKDLRDLEDRALKKSRKENDYMNN